MKSKRCDNAKSKSIYNISHRLLLSVESSKKKKREKKSLRSRKSIERRMHSTIIIFKYY